MTEKQIIPTSVWRIASGVVLGGVILFLSFAIGTAALEIGREVKSCGSWEAWMAAARIQPEHAVELCRI